MVYMLEILNDSPDEQQQASDDNYPNDYFLHGKLFSVDGWFNK